MGYLIFIACLLIVYILAPFINDKIVDSINSPKAKKNQSSAPKTIQYYSKDEGILYQMFVSLNGIELRLPDIKIVEITEEFSTFFILNKPPENIVNQSDINDGNIYEPFRSYYDGKPLIIPNKTSKTKIRATKGLHKLVHVYISLDDISLMAMIDEEMSISAICEKGSRFIDM